MKVRKRVFKYSSWVITIISILIFILTVKEIQNPRQRFFQDNNQQREKDLNTILVALTKYQKDTGNLPPSIDAQEKTIQKYNGADICGLLIPKYLLALPADPSGGVFDNCDSYNTAYSIFKDSANHLTLTAKKAELGASIKVGN